MHDVSGAFRVIPRPKSTQLKQKAEAVGVPDYFVTYQSKVRGLGVTFRALLKMLGTLSLAHILLKKSQVVLATPATCAAKIGT